MQHTLENCGCCWVLLRPTNPNVLFNYPDDGEKDPLSSLFTNRVQGQMHRTAAKTAVIREMSWERTQEAQQREKQNPAPEGVGEPRAAGPGASNVSWGRSQSQSHTVRAHPEPGAALGSPLQEGCGLWESQERAVMAMRHWDSWGCLAGGRLWGLSISV